MKTSKIEIIDLFKAWIAISIAFTIVLRSLTESLTLTFILSLLTVGIGFLFHELAHKFTAQNYGYKAEFRSFDLMLLIAIITSFFGFILAAPGATMIASRRINKERYGKIAAAGPITNLILAVLFFIVIIFSTGFIKLLAVYGYRINTWLALFNMIPIWEFDGKKIISWNKSIYFLIIIIAVIFLIVPGL